MPVSKNDLMMLASRTIGNTSDSRSFPHKYLEFLDFVASHESDLTTEARQYAESIWQSLMDSWGQAVDKKPESVEKRKAKRMIAFAAGKHLNAKRCLDKLTYSTSEQAKSTNELQALFLQLVQSTLDMLHDLTQNELNGVARAAIAILLYWAVDELLVAFHLARCTFCTQANAHARTVVEILDKVDLFYQQPQWAEIWASGDEAKAWKDLRPGEVRKKLGKVDRDPFFSHLSKHGTHATFTGAQRRTRTEKNNSPTPHIGISVGGVRRNEEQTFSKMGCIVAAGCAVLKAATVLSSSLHVDEVSQMTHDAKVKINDFLRGQPVTNTDTEVTNIQELIQFWRDVSQ